MATIAPAAENITVLDLFNQLVAKHEALVVNTPTSKLLEIIVEEAAENATAAALGQHITRDSDPKRITAAEAKSEIIIRTARHAQR